MTDIIEHNPIVLCLDDKKIMYLMDLITGVKNKVSDKIGKRFLDCIEFADYNTIINRKEGIRTASSGRKFIVAGDSIVQDIWSGEILQEDFGGVESCIERNNYFKCHHGSGGKYIELFEYKDRKMISVAKYEHDSFLSHIYRNEYIIISGYKSNVNSIYKVGYIKDLPTKQMIRRIDEDRFYYFEDKHIIIFTFDCEFNIIEIDKIKIDADILPYSFHARGNIFCVSRGLLHKVDVVKKVVSNITISDNNKSLIFDISYLGSKYLYIGTGRNFFQERFFNIYDFENDKVVMREATDRINTSIRRINDTYIMKEEQLFNLSTLKYEHPELHFVINMPFRSPSEIEHMKKVINGLSANIPISQNLKNLISKFI